jgi:uncharacterized repeat protein (TIGR02059 family)
MRYLLILVLLWGSLTISGTTYYIDPSGNNSNNGSSGSPWKTLAYACSKVSVSGDIIHVNAGTYYETVQSLLAAGVSIEGAGNTSIIHSELTGSYMHTILLMSSAEGTDGKQSISYIRMVSDLDAWGAVRVEKRKNVNIHHCEFENFFTEGVMFCGVTYGTENEPVTYATGNSFHDNKVTNCATYSGSGPYGAGRGNLTIGGQKDMLIYNNTIVQKDRGAGLTGFCIKYIAGYFKGVKIYNNTITKPAYDGVTWDFAIELWNCRGGIEIYNNNIQGSIDISGNTSITNDAGGYGFAVKIYNNTIGFPTMQSGEQLGIDIERGQTGGFYVYNNIFKNVEVPFIFWQGNTDLVKDIYIYYNVCNGIGRLGGSNGNGSYFGTIDGNNIAYDNLHFVNNVFYAGTSGNPGTGVRCAFPGSATNINVRNNIIQGFDQPVYVYSAGTMGSISIENNLYFGNSSNAVLWEKTPGSKIDQLNRIGNPNFVSAGSNFHLTGASTDAINYGKHITTPTILADFDGVTIGTVPEIGAYEYGATTTPPVVPVYQISSVENATPSILTMTYNLSLANIVPATASFTATVNSVARTISSVAVSGSNVQLSLASPVLKGDIVAIAYTIPASNPLQTTSGGKAATITAQPVTNNCINAAPSVAITSPVTSSAFTALSNISITANAIDADGSVSLVEFYSGSTKLGSKSVAPYTFAWNNVAAGSYSLTAIATDNLNAKTTSAAISVSVTSKNSTNKKPVVKISNPRKGNTYEKLSSISIDAVASDPDGTISKVELFSGTVKLVEMTTAPYSFTWKDVAAGNYRITAIATDNMNDTTISSPVEFIVGTTVKYDANSDIVKLYPNPNNGHFSIEFINPIQSERSEIIITDLAGKQVYNGPLLKEETLKKFDLSESRSGVYVMMIKDKDIYVTKKFIKN